MQNNEHLIGPSNCYVRTVELDVQKHNSLCVKKSTFNGILNCYIRAIELDVLKQDQFAQNVDINKSLSLLCL